MTGAVQRGPVTAVRFADGARSGLDGGLHELTIPRTPCRNPAFDVTPASLVTALVTERGVARPGSGASVLSLLRA
jgi:methylthioribose-1-phosphate isomerase